MAARPGDETQQVIEALTTAFIQGRLGKDEFDERVGQALAAYAELDAATADIPPVPSPASSVAPSAAEQAEVARRAYNRGLVARGTFGAAGGFMLLTGGVVTAVSGNPFVGLLAGGVIGVLMAAVLGAFFTLLLWALESSEGRSTRRTRPPRARGGAAERLASAEQADPAKPRQDHWHAAQASAF